MFSDSMSAYWFGVVMGLICGIMIASSSCHGAENPNPYKPMGSSTSQEIKIKKQMFNACVSSGESRARCYRIYYGN